MRETFDAIPRKSLYSNIPPFMSKIWRDPHHHQYDVNSGVPDSFQPLPSIDRRLTHARISDGSAYNTSQIPSIDVPVDNNNNGQGIGGGGSNNDAVLIASAAYARAMKDAMMMQSQSKAEAPGSQIVIQNHSQASCEGGAGASDSLSVLERGTDLINRSLETFQVFWSSRLNRFILLSGMGLTAYGYFELKAIYKRNALRRARIILSNRRPLHRVRNALSVLLSSEDARITAQLLVDENQNEFLNSRSGLISWLWG